jgi:hypothetical protein
LLDINENYGTNYPADWTKYTIVISGVSQSTTGRFAFRYFVESGGPSGDNSDYIGIDLVQYAPGELVQTNYVVNFGVVEVNGATNGNLWAELNGNAITSGSSVEGGSDVVFTAVPASGYHVKEWQLDGTLIAGNTSNNYTLGNIAANATVTVEFELITFAVNFIVKATDNALLENAAIAINSQSITTNQNGEASIQLVPGTYPYTVTKTDYMEVTGSVTIINADVAENVLMSHVSIQDGVFASFMAYPNPFSNVIMISNPSVVKHVSIASINGQVISEMDTEGAASVSTEHLPAGMYLITFESHNGQRFISKMVKK